MGVDVGTSVSMGEAEGLATGVTCGVGLGVREATGLGVAEKVTWGIWDELKKSPDSTLLRVAVSSAGLKVCETSCGTLGSGAVVMALNMVNPIHIRTVTRVKTKSVIRLGNLVFCILTPDIRDSTGNN